MYKSLTQPLIKPSTQVLLLGIILLLQSTALFANITPIPAFKASYQADIKGFRVKASRELSNNNGEQTLHFKASSMIASLEERAKFTWVDGQLQPLQYAYLQNVVGKKEKRKKVFGENGN